MLFKIIGTQSWHFPVEKNKQMFAPERRKFKTIFKTQPESVANSSALWHHQLGVHVPGLKPFPFRFASQCTSATVISFSYGVDMVLTSS